MNACIRAVVRMAWQRGVATTGIRRGYAGLLDGEMEPLLSRGVANIIQRGGTILETSRSEELKTPEGRRCAAEQLRAAEIEALVAIGGDGTFRGLAALQEETGMVCIGVPGTIDNDVFGTDYTIGFDTAVNTALEAIDRIRDTAASHERLFFVEVMGRSSGFIAAEVGIAGGAEDVLVPELPTSLEALCQVLQESRDRGKKSSIVIVAEGDEAGGALGIASQVKARLGMESRICILGHIQRGGAPTARDRVLASMLGAGAVEGLLHGHAGTMVGQVRGELSYTPLRETWKRAKPLDARLLDLARVLAG